MLVAIFGAALIDAGGLKCGMTHNRIREIREKRGWTQTELGERVGRSKSQISRVEDGTTKLDLDTATQVARALGVSLADVLGIGPTFSDVSDDAAVYQPSLGDPLLAHVRDRMRWYKVSTDVLDKAGISSGDVVLVNESVTALSQIEPLRLVLALYHPRPDSEPTQIVRQFVPPGLLITNSSRGNKGSLDMATDPVKILGLIEEINRSFTRN